jgi:hypothetical protein
MDNKFIEIFEDYFVRSGTKFFKLNNTLWYEYNNVLIPVGPAKFDYSLNYNHQKQLLSLFPQVFFIRSNNGFKELHTSEIFQWYAVIKNRFVERENIKSYEARKKIKKGLEFCKVEKVDADLIARKGFDIFYAAVNSYKGKIKFDLNKNRFTQKYNLRNNYPEIFHYWGVFDSSGLIGYAENLIYGSIEASYSTMKFLPEKFTLFPTYALVYSMDEFYLKRLNFEYVNDGFRSILHETNIQDFLIKNFHFFKQSTVLNIYYKPLIGIMIRVGYPFRKLMNLKYLKSSKLEALFSLEEIRRSYLV